MPIGRRPPSGLICPLCQGKLETWARRHLFVEFCHDCSALFLDRGELFEMFKSEGYRCPPEALLRHQFEERPGSALRCPKCAKASLTPGTLQGCEVWHCKPCNGFLVDRGMLLGPEADCVPLDTKGFERVGEPGRSGDSSVSETMLRMLRRVAFWESSVQEQQ